MPTSGKVYAPADGVVSATFETKHAIGLTTDTGIELLIHIGIDAVKLGGECFKEIVKKGQRVQKGDLLLEFELDKMAASGVDPTTMVIITNSQDYLEILPVKDKEVHSLDQLLTVI